MMEVNYEQIRESVLLIQKAIEIHDQVTEAIVDNRVKFEALRRMPELGQGQRGTATESDAKAMIERLRRQQVEHANIITYLTSTGSVDEARQHYLDLLTAFQRVGSLRELERLVLNSFPAAIKEAKEQFNLPAEMTDVADIAVIVFKEMQEAADRLALVSAVEIPSISPIELPAAGIRLAH